MEECLVNQSRNAICDISAEENDEASVDVEGLWIRSLVPILLGKSVGFAEVEFVLVERRFVVLTCVDTCLVCIGGFVSRRPKHLPLVLTLSESFLHIPVFFEAFVSLALKLVLLQAELLSLFPPNFSHLPGISGLRPRAILSSSNHRAVSSLLEAAGSVAECHLFLQLPLLFVQALFCFALSCSKSSRSLH